MSTVAAVKKNGKIAIAADTLVSSDSEKLTAKYLSSKNKIIQFGENHFAFTGSISWDATLFSYFKEQKKPPILRTELAVYEFLLTMVRSLEEKNYMNVYEGEDRDFKQIGLWGLLANKHGIFSIENAIGIQKYTRYYAMGSGGEYALGAIYSRYSEKNASALDVVKAGVCAACEFDKSSDLPITSKVIELA